MNFRATSGRRRPSTPPNATVCRRFDRRQANGSADDAGEATFVDLVGAR
jgi:hypothetical protein